MNFTEIDKQGTVDGFALVKSCEKKGAKNGTFYLDMVLSDGSDEIIAKVWNYSEENYPVIEINTLVRVRGLVQQYNNQSQLRVDRIRYVNEKDGVNIEDFVPKSEFTGDFMMAEIRKIVEDFSDSQLKKLVLAVLEEYGERMLVCPAAFRLHHALRGGLLYHTLSLVRLSQALSALYPSVDRELLISGAILHDVAKTEEFELSPTGLVDRYTTDGALIGHLVRGAMAIERIGTEKGINKDVLMLVEHMLISHHGIPEFGAAVRPAFLEAEILSQLDLLDARIYEIEKNLSEIIPNEFTQRIWSLDDRKFYNHARKAVKPTAKLDTCSFD